MCVGPLVGSSLLDQKIPSSRLLNEKVTYAGLLTEDVIAIMVTFFFGFSFFGFFDLPLLSVPLSLLFATSLVFVRLKYRKRKVRDFLRFQYVRLFKNGVIYDSSNRRYN